MKHIPTCPWRPPNCVGNTKLTISLLWGNNIVQVNLYVSRWTNRTLFWHTIFIIVIKYVWAQIPGARSLGSRRTCRYMWHNVIYRSYNVSVKSLIALHCVVWNLWRCTYGVLPILRSFIEPLHNWRGLMDTNEPQFFTNELNTWPWQSSNCDTKLLFSLEWRNKVIFQLHLNASIKRSK